MEWKTDCCELKNQKNIVVKNKKENPNEFVGKLSFDNAKQYLCLDVDISCQLIDKKGSIKSCDSLLVVFNTKNKKKLKAIDNGDIQQMHFMEFKSGDISGAFTQIISTVQNFNVKDKFNFGYVVRNPKRKLYAKAQDNLKKYNKAQKGKILFQIKKSTNKIILN